MWQATVLWPQGGPVSGFAEEDSVDVADHAFFLLVVTI
jgi:hypothetical protein